MEADLISLPDTTKAITSAIETGDLKALQEVIDLASEESDRLMGGTPLMLAATMGQSEIVKWLLGNPNCDINAQDENNNWTALMQAVFHGHYRIVEYLLTEGADPDIGNTDGLNAYSIAAMLNDDYMTDLLIKQNRVNSGKKWWAKLTTKFSTIRALTAFKTKVKAETELFDDGNPDNPGKKTPKSKQEGRRLEKGGTLPEQDPSPMDDGRVMRKSKSLSRSNMDCLTESDIEDGFEEGNEGKTRKTEDYFNAMYGVDMNSRESWKENKSKAENETYSNKTDDGITENNQNLPISRSPSTDITNNGKSLTFNKHHDAVMPEESISVHDKLHTPEGVESPIPEDGCVTDIQSPEILSDKVKKRDTMKPLDLPRDGEPDAELISPIYL